MSWVSTAEEIELYSNAAASGANVFFLATKSRAQRFLDEKYCNGISNIYSIVLY